MSKKKVFDARTLKEWTKFTTQNNENQKRKSSFFNTRQNKDTELSSDILG